MRTCPTCKGKKVQTVTVHEAGATSSFDTECLVCKGKGEVTDAQYRAEERWRNSWCSCGNKSREVQFFDDGQHPGCKKHHWRCADCGKILQVG